MDQLVQVPATVELWVQPHFSARQHTKVWVACAKRKVRTGLYDWIVCNFGVLLQLLLQILRAKRMADLGDVDQHVVAVAENDEVSPTITKRTAAKVHSTPVVSSLVAAAEAAKKTARGT